MKSLKKIANEDLFQLPNGESIHLSHIRKIGDIVNFTEGNGSKQNFTGFTIILQNGMIKNIVNTYNANNEKKIKFKMQQIYLGITSLFQAQIFLWKSK